MNVPGRLTDGSDVGCKSAREYEQDEHAEGYYVDRSAAVHLVLLVWGRIGCKKNLPRIMELE